MWNSNQSRLLSSRWLILAGILTLATALRLMGLSAESLWVDEACSLQAARAPKFATLWSTLQETESSPPLFFVLLHAWRLGGETLFYLRCLSVLFGLAGVAAMWALAHALYGKREALFGSLLLAVSQYHV